jgi:molybdopterin biosynthesis enzyme MoaB
MRTPQHFNTRSLSILRATSLISAIPASPEGSSDHMEKLILLIFQLLSIIAVASDEMWLFRDDADHLN